MPIHVSIGANATVPKSQQATPCLKMPNNSLEPLSRTVEVAKAPKVRAKLILIKQMLKLSKVVQEYHRFIQPDNHYSPLFNTHFLSWTFDPTRSAICSRVCLIESFGCLGNLDLSVGCQLFGNGRNTASSKPRADQLWSDRCLVLPF